MTLAIVVVGPELTFPQPNAEAQDWIEAHTTPGEIVDLTPWRTDSPDCVKAYIAARDRWFAARAELPIDWDETSYRFRMFGGAWISGNAMVHANGRCEHIASQASHALNATPERFREWAIGVYELLGMRDALDQRLLAAVQRR